MRLDGRLKVIQAGSHYNSVFFCKTMRENTEVYQWTINAISSFHVIKREHVYDEITCTVCVTVLSVDRF